MVYNKSCFISLFMYVCKIELRDFYDICVCTEQQTVDGVNTGKFVGIELDFFFLKNLWIMLNDYEL